MHKPLFRSNTRKSLHQALVTMICLTLASPPMALGDETTDRADARSRADRSAGDRRAGADRDAAAAREFDRRSDEANALNQQRSEAHKARIQQLEREAAALRQEALELLQDPAKHLPLAAEFALERRRAVFFLDPTRGPQAAATAPAVNPTGTPAGATVTATAPAAAGTTVPATAPAAAAPGVRVVMTYESALPPEQISHISGKRIPYLRGFGALATRIRHPLSPGETGAMESKGTEMFDTASGVLAKGNPQQPTILKESSGYRAALIAQSKAPEILLDPNAINAVNLHLLKNSDVGRVPVNNVKLVLPSGAVTEDENMGRLVGAHAPQPVAPVAPGTPAAAIPAPEELDLSGIFANDVERSVTASTEVLQAALRKLNAAKDKIAEAAEARANPPKKTNPSNTAKNNQSPGGGGDDKGGDAGKGDGKGDKGNGDKGQPLQAPTIAQPGSMGDSRALFDAAKNAPITPDVAAVAEASKSDQTPFPQFGGLPPNTIQIPGISRQQPQTVAATSGAPPTNAPTNIIPGEFRPAQAIDRGMFDKPAGGEGGGGASERPPSVSTGGTGGVAGGSFEGDIGKGMGPSYGGKAGLNDPVKKYEVGTGGGTNNTETTGTISTGAEGGIPPALQGQLASGKKMKDGPGRGAMGLMGQVFSLIQTQCTDQTQRNKMESFCVNASQVSGRAQGKELAYSKPAAPRRDLASDRGVTSSK